MKKQSASHFLQFYPTHHFIFYPVMTVLAIFCFYRAYATPETALWSIAGAGFLSLIWLSYMLRQHYALILQDRIIRLEFAQRYFCLAGKKWDGTSSALTDAQLFALRFASDEEFLGLLETAIAENYSAGRIRHSIKNWQADRHRV